VADDTRSQVVAAHERRLAALDPLLRRTHPFPDPEQDDVVLTTDGALALLRRHRPDPESLQATWGAAVQHRLSVRVADHDPAGALDALLTQCREQVLPQAGHDHDAEVNLIWPSRDTTLTRPLLTHGLVPSTTVAARPAGRVLPRRPADVRVRPLEPGDIDAATALWLEEVRWAAQFGTATVRPSTTRAIRRELIEVLTHHRQWAWVAEDDGRVHGLLVVQPPDRASWIARLVSRSPVAYLSCLVVTAGRRGDGVGAALARRAHDALDAAGVEVTLLHYAALNPLSAPFWHHCGYRPLWTVWHARPVTRFGQLVMSTRAVNRWRGPVHLATIERVMES
jgi:GNAT superfamily N-acetyltransferase